VALLRLREQLDARGLRSEAGRLHVSPEPAAPAPRS
jgi:hypothetical protein